MSSVDSEPSDATARSRALFDQLRAMRGGDGGDESPKGRQAPADEAVGASPGGLSSDPACGADDAGPGGTSLSSAGTAHPGPVPETASEADPEADLPLER